MIQKGDFSLPRLEWPVQWGRDNGAYIYERSISPSRPGYAHVEGLGELLMLSSYSYLGLIGHPEIDKAAKQAIDEQSTGTHGVRLLAGTTALHKELEALIAGVHGTEDCVVLSSGYIANVSVITALAGRGDAVVCDKLDHASIMDGCRLSGAEIYRFHHNKPEHLRRILAGIEASKNKLVICDSVFSMDGDIADLPAIAAACREYGALLMIDEAHSLGVIGATGRGIEEHFSLPAGTVDITVGTLSKAIPSAGGYVCAPRRTIDIIRHRGRGYIYSAALPPPGTAAAIAALQIMARETWRVRRLQRNALVFRDRLAASGIDVLRSETAIVPALCGDDHLAFLVAKDCVEQGIFVQGIPHPVVPRGSARLRCIVTADHSVEDLEQAADCIAGCFRARGGIRP